MMCCQQTKSRILLVFISLLVFASLVFLFLSPQPSTSTFVHGNISSDNVIWVFWDKPPMPAIIRLSLATVICHNRADNVHMRIINESQISHWIDDIHPAFEYLIPAHKADYFRARILDTHGGMYMDADTIGLGSVLHLFDKLNAYDLVNIDWMPDRDILAISVMGPCRAHSSFGREWVRGLHKLLDKKLLALRSHWFAQLHASHNHTAKYPIRWAEMLREIAVPVIRELLRWRKFRYFRFTGHKTFGQLTHTGNGHPFSDFTKSNFSFNETELLMFHQSGLEDSIRKLSVDELLHGNYLFSSLVRYSMNECREGRSQLKRNKTITVDVSTARNDDLIQWIQSFLSRNDL